MYRQKTATSRAKFSKEVMARDIHCRAYIGDLICHEGPLDPHHITGRTSVIDDNPRNGIALCRKHHSLVTDGKIKVQASWQTPDQIEWIEKRKYPGWEKVLWD